MRSILFSIINHTWFEISIMTLIIGNVAFMAIQQDDQSQALTNASKQANYFFSAAFIIEAALKISAMGYSAYWNNDWNKLDFLVVFSSTLDFALDYLPSDSSSLSFAPLITKMIRIFRVLRIIKLVKRIEGLHRLISTILFSLPSLINVSSLVFLSYYIFSILASFLFHDITF